jgi:hypothetical protein
MWEMRSGISERVLLRRALAQASGDGIGVAVHGLVDPDCGFGGILTQPLPRETIRHV